MYILLKKNSGNNPIIKQDYIKKKKKKENNVSCQNADLHVEMMNYISQNVDSLVKM